MHNIKKKLYTKQSQSMSEIRIILLKYENIIRILNNQL